MTRAYIDPVTRIEGHLRVEMEVNNGVVEDAWVSGGAFRGMELVLQDRTPFDACEIVQRICGVCPIAHANASAIAGERAMGITISNGARLVRNIIEGAQFLHSNIQWFYNLCALDYVNPLNALDASVADAYDICEQLGLGMDSDLAQLKEKLARFAANGQLSIFSGNWFGADGGSAYKLSPEVDLICTSHYIEALQIQCVVAEIAAIAGGKMPHVMTILPGGTSFVPTENTLDDLLARSQRVLAWCKKTLVQDSVILGNAYPDALKWGKGCGSYVAWGVFEGPEWPYGGDYQTQMLNRYLPMGVLDKSLGISNVDESLITEYMGHSWYKGDETYTSPYFVTDPDFTTFDVDDRYTWVKCPAYNGSPMEATALSRVLVAYKRGVADIVDATDALITSLGGAKGDLSVLQSTMGRTASRQVETVYTAELMVKWCEELMQVVKEGDGDYFRDADHTTGSGTGFWEAPRGALYHSEKIKDGKIEGYQIIIPSTWNLAPKNAAGVHGPMEQSLIGVPVDDIEMPINALRTVHSYDPCTACAVHITEPATGREFKTVTNPWGVK